MIIAIDFSTAGYDYIYYVCVSISDFVRSSDDLALKVPINLGFSTISFGGMHVPAFS